MHSSPLTPCQVLKTGDLTQGHEARRADPFPYWILDTAYGGVGPSLHLDSIVELALNVGITPELSQGHGEYRRLALPLFFWVLGQPRERDILISSLLLC